MSPSQNSSSNGWSLLAKQKWQENKPFRYTINFIVTVGSTEILAVSAYLSPQHFPLLLTLLIALIPAMLLWWAIIVIQSYDNKALTYIKETAEYGAEIGKQIQINQELQSEINSLTAQFARLIQNAGETLELYPPFRKLLEKETGQKKLIGHFMDRSMIHALCVWNITRNDFLKLAQEGIRDCKKCQLIHHGSLKELQQHPYLTDLQTKTTSRIVILPNANIEEVKDNNEVSKFLQKVGNTPSYWIDEEKFFQIAELTDIKDRIRLDDCVILDEQLLLLWQHDRRIAVLSFKGETVYEGIIRAFNDLENQIRGYPNPDITYQFQKIVTLKNN